MNWSNPTVDVLVVVVTRAKLSQLVRLSLELDKCNSRTEHGLMALKVSKDILFNLLSMAQK